MRFPPNDIISLVGAAPQHELAESVGPDLSLAQLLDEEGLKRLLAMQLGYGTASGDAELRKEIAALHGVDPEDVVVTVGGMHALFLLGFILCTRGDEAVISRPVFPLARNVLDAVGATVKTVDFGFDSAYQPSVEAFQSALSPRTRLVSVASPQNPSGVALEPRVIEQLVKAMAETCPQAYLLVDETYREAAYGDDAAAVPAIHVHPRVVTVASLSKCHGVPGLRIGWAITRDAGLRDQLVLGKFNTVVSCSPVDEALALLVLQRRDPILAERRSRLQAGRAATEKWVRHHAELVEWVAPNAGALCCVRLREQRYSAEGVERFYAACATRGVRVAPGDWFGDERRVFRLGFGFMPGELLHAALDALGEALRDGSPQSPDGR
jgi:aspartate/methionine/tyrosine aminotransferase